MAKLDEEAKLFHFKTALADLEREWVEVNGQRWKPSQCYRLTEDPKRILYNVNCPAALKRKIEKLVRKYLT